MTAPAREQPTPLAVQFTQPGRVDLVPEDAQPLLPGSVRVETLYSGISAGTELTAFRGTNVYLDRTWDPESRLFTDDPGAGTFHYPLIGWGYSEVGSIVEVSADGDVGPLKIGDKVHGVWGHRSQAVLPARDLHWRVLPEGLDPIAGTFTRVGAIALNAVLGANLHIGETVAIFGQGVIGLLATKLATLSGARVVAVDGLRPRLDRATQMGAHAAIDVGDGPVAERIRTAVGGDIDAVIELSGNHGALREAIRIAPVAGRVVAAGFYQGNPHGLRLGDEFHHNRIQLVASQIGDVPRELQPRWNTRRLHQVIDQLVAAGDLPVTSLVTDLVPAGQAQAAYDKLDQGDPETLQVVLDFRSRQDRHQE